MVTNVGTGKAVHVINAGMSTGYVKSPVVPLGSEDVTSMRFDLIVDQNFYINAQVLSATGTILTSFSKSSNTLTVDGQQHTFPAHGSRVNIRIDAHRTTHFFTMYIDGQSIHTAVAPHADVQQLYIYVGNLYLDGFSVSNGTGPEFSKTINPISGILQPGTSQTVSIAFNPTNAESGVYEDVIILASDTLGITKEIPVHLTVIQDTAAARPAVVAAETVSERFSVYPVPVSDEFHISLPAAEQGRVRILIHDRVGNVLYTNEGATADFQDYTVNAQDAGLTAGFYYLRVEYSNGKRDVRKFMKK